MNLFAKPADKKSLKIYFLIISLVFVAFVLVVNFQIFPAINQGMSEISPQKNLDMGNSGYLARYIEHPTRYKFYFGSIGFLIFLFLINTCFWIIDDKLTKQESEIKKNLDTNPDDSVLKYELMREEKKIKLFFYLGQLIFFIGIGAALSFVIFYIILPVYRLSFLTTF